MAALNAGLENYTAIVQHMNIYAREAANSIGVAITVQAVPVLTTQVQQIVSLVSCFPPAMPHAHIPPIMHHTHSYTKLNHASERGQMLQRRV